MDINSLYKKVKKDQHALISREKELIKKLEEVKRLKLQNDKRRAKVEALEAEVEQYLKSLDQDS